MQKKTIQNTIDPLVISWGWESDIPSQSQFIDYHQYQGTNDISSYLTIPTVIKFFKEKKWELVQDDCHALLIKASKLLKKNSTVVDFEPCSNNDENIGQMLSFKINSNSNFLCDLINNPNKIIYIQNEIFNYSRIRIPIIIWKNEIFTRLSIQAYNKEEEIYTLIDTLKHFNLL